MNAVSAEPNVRPITVYWDRVVLVSVEAKADLINQTWGLSMMVLVATVGILKWLFLAPARR